MGDKTLGEKCLLICILIVILILIALIIGLLIIGHFCNTRKYSKVSYDIIDYGEMYYQTERNNFIAALMVYIDSENFVCNVNLLTPYWSISSAHCLSMINSLEYVNLLSLWFLKAGIVRWNSKGYTRWLERYVIHPSYNKFTLENNIGLVKVTRRWYRDESIGFISISSLQNNEQLLMATTNMSVIGWGKFVYEIELPDFNLKILPVRILNRQKCMNKIPNSNYISEKYICALVKQNNNSFENCYPDAGSSLIFGNNMLGLISPGEKCLSAIPHFFLTLNVFEKWIETVINI